MLRTYAHLLPNSDEQAAQAITAITAITAIIVDKWLTDEAPQPA